MLYNKFFDENIQKLAVLIHIFSYFSFLFLFKSTTNDIKNLYCFAIISLIVLFASLIAISLVYKIKSSLIFKIQFLFKLVIPSSFIYFSFYFLSDVVSSPGHLLAIILLSFLMLFCYIFWLGQDKVVFLGRLNEIYFILRKKNISIFLITLMVTYFSISDDYLFYSLFVFFKIYIIPSILLSCPIMALCGMIDFWERFEKEDKKNVGEEI